MKIKMHRRILPLLVGFLVFLAGCYTVPETGRRAFVILPQGDELALGQQAFSEIKQTERVSNDQEAIDRVRRVGGRIAAVAGEDLPKAEWEFVVFEDDVINAFALPGGKVGVYKGLLRVADTDAELAVVMGHEVAHVTARHGAERYSTAVALLAGGLALDVATQEDKHRDALLLAYGIGATLGVMLPHSRRNEREADEIGLYYMARAGYDPRAAVAFWEKMQAESQRSGQPPEFLSTHPSDDTRIRFLNEKMPRALSMYQEQLAAR